VNFQLLDIAMVAKKLNTASHQSHFTMFPITSPSNPPSQELYPIILEPIFDYEISHQSQVVGTFFV
jgi:hypothetical protein